MNTTAFAIFISPDARFALPGAPFVLSAMLLASSLLVAVAFLPRVGAAAAE